MEEKTIVVCNLKEPANCNSSVTIYRTHEGVGGIVMKVCNTNRCVCDYGEKFKLVKAEK